MKTSTSRRRLSLAAVLAALALTFAACGSDGGNDADATTTTTTEAKTTTTAADDGDTTTTTESTDDGDTTTTTESTDDGDTTTTTESGSPDINGMAKDMIVDQYKKMGMTEDQANCAADLVLDKMGSGGDMSGIAELGQELMSKCDIDPTKLSFGGSN